MKSARKNLDEAGIREKLSMLEMWRASGLSMAAWVQGQGLDARALMGALAYEGRWRRKLAGQPIVRKRSGSGSGFARVKKVANEASVSKPEISSETVHLEVAGVVMHWPVSRGVELARWLQSLKAAGA